MWSRIMPHHIICEIGLLCDNRMRYTNRNDECGIPVTLTDSMQAVQVVTCRMKSYRWDMLTQLKSIYVDCESWMNMLSM